MNGNDNNMKAKAGLFGLIATAPALSGEVISNMTQLTLSIAEGNLLLWDIDGSNSSTLTSISSTTAAFIAFNSNTDADAGIWVRPGGQGFNSFVGPQNPGETLRSAAIQWTNTTGLIARNLGTGYELGPNNFENTNVFGLGLIYTSQFPSETNGYIGFRFTTNGGTPFYGWAEVVLNTSTDEFSILQWAYEDDGSIDSGLTGAGNGSIRTPIPEPAEVVTGLAALALGTAGVRRWRKHKLAAD